VSGGLRGTAGRLGSLAAVLGAALGQWAARDDTRAEPEVRQSANVAMGAIDQMLAELHKARQQLLGEIRQSDDAAVARAGALLEQARREAPDVH
jgi:hypothetical protein